MSNLTQGENSFLDRAIATITEACGPHREEWSAYDNDIINQARDADDEIARLRAVVAEVVEPELERWCDNCGGNDEKCPATCYMKVGRKLLGMPKGFHYGD